MKPTQTIIVRLKGGRVTLRVPKGKIDIKAFDKEGKEAKDCYEQPYYLGDNESISIGFDFWKNKRFEL